MYPAASKILPVCDVLWEFLRPNQKNKRLSHLWNIYEYGWVLKFNAEIQPSGLYYLSQSRTNQVDFQFSSCPQKGNLPESSVRVFKETFTNGGDNGRFSSHFSCNSSEEAAQDCVMCFLLYFILQFWLFHAWMAVTMLEVLCVSQHGWSKKKKLERGGSKVGKLIFVACFSVTALLLPL